MKIKILINSSFRDTKNLFYKDIVTVKVLNCEKEKSSDECCQGGRRQCNDNSLVRSTVLLKLACRNKDDVI